VRRPPAADDIHLVLASGRPEEELAEIVAVAANVARDTRLLR
jgi:hypothetical protein